MDESVVAKKAITIIKRTLVRARKVPQPALIPQQNLDKGEDASDILGVSLDTQRLETDSYDISADDDLGWLDCYPLDPQQAMFWTEWAHEIDLLGS